MPTNLKSKQEHIFINLKNLKQMELTSNPTMEIDNGRTMRAKHCVMKALSKKMHVGLVVERKKRKKEMKVAKIF